jgi:hypothetical protein
MREILPTEIDTSISLIGGETIGMMAGKGVEGSLPLQGVLEAPTAKGRS